MRVGILHDFARDECPGGANETLRRLYEMAPRNIELYWLRVGDLLPIFNLDNFIVASTRSVPGVKLDRILEGKKYVKIFLDYHYCPPKITRSASLLVYMSPRQKLDMLGPLVGCNFHILPSLVDPDDFYPADELGQGHLWVGNYSRQKGIRNLWEWAEDNKIHIDCYGHGVSRVYLEQSEYCHIRVPVPYEEMPDLYRKYDTLVHLPKGNEAGSRVFIEAILSGLTAITNEVEGDLSYENAYSRAGWRNRLRAAPAKFWQQTVNALQG